MAKLESPVGLIGVGAYVPARVMPNAEWSQYVDTTDEWIRERTGIERRRVAAPGETTVDLAEQAARSCLIDAGLEARDVDEIILATDTPEVFSPDTASFVQHRLGARPIPCYDLGGSGCAGFLQGVDIARSRIGAARRHILVIGVEVPSKAMDWHDRNICVLFGDGAGAALVGAGPRAAAILSFVSGTDGAKAGILGRLVGGVREPFSAEVLRQNRHHSFVMNGREVFKEAVAHMTEASRQALAQAGKSLAEVGLVIPHQANQRILEAVSHGLGLPAEKVYSNVADYGNTGSASVPLALWEARRQGRVRAGDLVLLTAFGAGFHWAAALVQF